MTCYNCIFPPCRTNLHQPHITQHTMNQCTVNLFQVKSPTFHPSLYQWQWPWMAPHVQLSANMWGTANATDRKELSGSGHVSQFTQVDGLNKSSDGHDNLKGCNQQLASQYTIHTLGNKSSHPKRAPVPYPSGTQNGLKKPLLGLNPDGLLYPQHHQLQSRSSVPGSPTKSTPHQNGYTFTITDYPAKYLSKSLSKFPPHSNIELNCHQLKPDSLPYILPVHNQTLQTPRGVAPLQPPAATVMETPAKKEYRYRPPRGQTPPKGYVCHLCFIDGHHYIYDCPKVQLRTLYYIII